MKLAVVFEIDPAEAGEYVRLADQLIAAHRFAKTHDLPHWSFNMQMRPIAAAAADHDDELIEGLRQVVESLPPAERA